MAMHFILWVIIYHYHSIIFLLKLSHIWPLATIDVLLKCPQSWGALPYFLAHKMCQRHLNAAKEEIPT